MKFSGTLKSNQPISQNFAPGVSGIVEITVVKVNDTPSYAILETELQGKFLQVATLLQGLNRPWLSSNAAYRLRLVDQGQEETMHFRCVD